MRTAVAILSALALSALGVLVAMPAMSNGGILDGVELFGLLAIGLLSAGVYAMVARARTRRSSGVWLAALIVGTASPFLVLTAPLAYCIAFQQNKSCV